MNGIEILNELRNYKNPVLDKKSFGLDMQDKSTKNSLSVLKRGLTDLSAIGVDPNIEDDGNGRF